MFWLRENGRRGRRGSTPVAYVASLLAVAAATLVAVIVDRAIAIPNLSLIFVLPVVLAAVSFGFAPSLAAAVGGVVAYNFFLIEPRYTFRVSDPANVWALVLLSAVAALGGERGVVIVTDQRDELVWRAARNLDRVHVVTPNGLCLLDLLRLPSLVFTESAVAELTRTLTSDLSPVAAAVTDGAQA